MRPRVHHSVDGPQFVWTEKRDSGSTRPLFYRFAQTGWPGPEEQAVLGPYPTTTVGPVAARPTNSSLRRPAGPRIQPTQRPAPPSPSSYNRARRRRRRAALCLSGILSLASPSLQALAAPPSADGRSSHGCWQEQKYLEEQKRRQEKDVSCLAPGVILSFYGVGFLASSERC